MLDAHISRLLCAIHFWKCQSTELVYTNSSSLKWRTRLRMSRDPPGNVLMFSVITPDLPCLVFLSFFQVLRSFCEWRSGFVWLSVIIRLTNCGTGLISVIFWKKNTVKNGVKKTVKKKLSWQKNNVFERFFKKKF